MSKDVNIHIKTETDKQKVDEYGNAFDKAGNKVTGAGSQAERTAGKMTALGSALNSVKGYLLGFATMGTLWAGFKTWLEWVNKIKKAQEELVESTRALDQAAKSLAGQANVLGKPGADEAARKQILDIHTAGRLGSWEVAESVATAAHSAFGTSGQLLTPDQLAIAGTVAGFAQRRNVDPGAIGDLFKLMAKMGVSNAQEAQWRIAQLSTVQQKSAVQEFKNFMPPAISSIIPAIGQGASPEMAMAHFMATVSAAGSAEEAATMTEQASAMLLRPSILEAIGPGTADLPYDHQLIALAQWVARSSKQQLQDAGMASGEVGTFKGMYLPEQVPLIMEGLALAKGAKAASVQAEAARWPKTTTGYIENIESIGQRAGATATPNERVGMALIKAGETEWNRIVRDKKEDWVWKDELEKDYKTVWKPLWDRHIALLDAIQQGTLPEDTAQEVEDAGRHIVDFMPEYRPEYWPIPSSLTSAKVGQADAMLRPLEGKAGVTINNYDHSTNMVYARPGIDLSPRVRPSDIEN